MQLYISLVILLAIAAMLLVSYRLSRCTFTCHNCGQSFFIRWRRALWVQHYNRDYILRCPHCGKKGWCTAHPPKSAVPSSSAAPTSQQKGEP